jgi:hypothetical protein
LESREKKIKRTNFVESTVKKREQLFFAMNDPHIHRRVTFSRFNNDLLNQPKTQMNENEELYVEAILFAKLYHISGTLHCGEIGDQDALLLQHLLHSNFVAIDQRTLLSLAMRNAY